MKRLAVVHYLPLEFYPPAVNLLNALAEKELFNTKVWTTHNNKQRQVFKSPTLTSISRTIAPKKSDYKGFRLLKYLLFNFKTFMGLLFFNPEVILYYESYSAGPVYWYLKYFGNNKRLFIHCHEYFDAQWYAKGMSLVKLYHTYEKNYLYPKAAWISQTNTDRIQMFASDHPKLPSGILKVVPNYPPQDWLRHTNLIKPDGHTVIKTVYVGSLSLKDTFIKEYCDWVLKQNGKVCFHVYAYNLDDDTIEYLSSLNTDYIVFYTKGVEYNKMPALLADYDIGLILYKAHTKNYKHNAPNKLFEYLACKLLVLYPDVMSGMALYQSDNVIRLNFEQIPSFNEIKKYFSNKTDLKSSYNAKTALQPLIDHLY